MNAPPGATLLAFDTSTERLAVAVSCASRTFVAEEAGGAAASGALLPCAERLLGEAGVRWPALDAIAFGRGPGAFTGLRTSCAVAQGLAVGLARPLLAIDSLLIVAEDARQQAGSSDHGDFDVDVVMDARMGEVYTGRYRWSGGHWSALQPAALLSPQALADRWQQAAPQALAGSALALAGGPWHGATPTGGCWPQEASRARALLSLARAAWADGATIDAAEALPTYLRNKVALTTAEREAAHQAKATLP